MLNPPQTSMNKRIEQIRKELLAWLIKVYGKQLTIQDIEDIVQDALKKCKESYPKKWQLPYIAEVQNIVFTIARNDALKTINKNKKIVIKDIQDYELFLVSQQDTAVIQLPWKTLLNHPGFIKKPHYRFIIQKIIDYAGECTGQDLYEAIIDEYEAQFGQRPTYDNYRKIKSRAAALLRKVLHKNI